MAKKTFLWMKAVSLGFCFSAQVFAASEPNPTNREVTRTFANFYLQQKDYLQAQNTLVNHLQDDRSDAVAWNMLGLLYTQSKQYEPAAKAFMEAANQTTGPTKGVYLYNYADAMARLGNVQKASRVLASASRYESVTRSAQIAREHLKSKQGLPDLEIQDPSAWHMILGLTAGYDSNVVLASDDQLATLSASDVGSPTVSSMVILNHDRPWGAGRLSWDSVLNYSWYSNSSAQTFNALALSTTADYQGKTSEEQTLFSKYGPQASVNYLNTDGMEFYSWSFGGHWSGTRVYSATRQLNFTIPLQYDKYATADSVEKDDRRSGPTLGLEADYAWMKDKNRFSVGGGYEFHLSQGKNYRAHTLQMPLRWGRPVFWGMQGTLGLSLGLVKYPSSDEGRTDKIIEPNLSFGKPLGDQWNGSFMYTFRKNISNVDTAAYRKHTILLTVTYDWF